MRFEQLRYLEAAIRIGTLRRAADDVGVAQPSLSQQIQRLEEELDLVLLQRSSSGVRPTVACLELLPQIRSALRAEEALFQEASALGGAQKGTVRLGAVGWPTQLLLPSIVRSFQASHPGIHLEAHEGNTQGLRKRVVDGELDLALLSSWVGTEWKSDSLRAVDLLPGVHLDLCVPHGHRLYNRCSVTTSDLEGESFIIPPQGHLLRLVFDRIARDVNVNVSYFTDTSATAIIMVAAEVGVSFLSRPSILNSREAAESKVRGIPIAEDWATGALTMVRRANEQPPPAVRALVEAIETKVKDFAAQKTH